MINQTSKMNSYFRKSLSRQFVALMLTFISLSFIAAVSLFWYQNKLTHEYTERNNELESKEAIAQKLDQGFNKAFFDSRGYFAFRNPNMLKSSLAQEQIVLQLNEQLEREISSNEDLIFHNKVTDFSLFYFDQLLPEAINYFEEGNIDAVIALSKNGGSQKVYEFQHDLREYRLDKDKEVEQNFKELADKMSTSQNAFILFVVTMFLSLLIITRMMVTQIGQPLRQLAEAAGNVAIGKNGNFLLQAQREDELGALSRSFEKMVRSIQDNEQDLTAQNEELQAQQDELQSQQIELEYAIDTMEKREEHLSRINALIRGLSHTLDKHTILLSIAENMCKLVKADSGIVVMLNEKVDHASVALSNNSIDQFKRHLYTGHSKRVLESKQPLTIKRRCNEEEKGYHTDDLYCYDLYLPVVSFSNEVTAIMVFTRLSDPFTHNDIEEFDSLSKQISISLENIQLYEKTEEDRIMNQEILNSIHEGIQLVGIDGSILQINDQMCEIIYYDHCKLMINKSITEWLHSLHDMVDNFEELTTYVSKAINSTNRQDNVFVYHINKPIHRVVKVYSVPIYRAGKKYGTVLVHRDITKEFEVDMMKSEFVSTVSHELRTPLSSVLGFTELMLNKELKPDRQKKYLTTIYNEAKRLTALINDFLDVQRMEAGKQTYDKKFEDLLPIIQNVIDTQKVNATNHQVSIEQLAETTIVLGDKDKLSQVFNNLISNAIKYSPEGGNIQVKMYEENEYLCVAVSDEGLGIPKESIEKLFTKFYRIDNSDRRRIGGTGLGLAIVKEIVQAHEGTVTVSSELKKGSTFVVKLPIVHTNSIEANERLKESEDNVMSNIHANVLLVEDDTNLASLLEAELRDSGFEVKHAGSGESALNQIKEWIPDAIVLDIMLEEKGIDGWDIIKELKKNEQLSKIPIFISSALEEKEKGLALGANEYLVKPYQPSKLSKTILQTLLVRDREGPIHIPTENFNSE
ncbi:response regulator [Bacillus timonensis]|nr:response regulator [Bacillus timonensis]